MSVYERGEMLKGRHGDEIYMRWFESLSDEQRLQVVKERAKREAWVPNDDGSVTPLTFSGIGQSRGNALDAFVDELLGRSDCNEDDVHSPPHYTRNRTIQPWDVAADWDLNYFEGNVLKYLSRYKRKGRPVEDLKKCREYLDYMIAREEAKADG